MEFITILQVVVSVVLVVSILMQNRGSSLGSAFGGGATESFHVKRGFEKFLFQTAIVFSFLFIALALVNVYLAGASVAV